MNIDSDSSSDDDDIVLVELLAMQNDSLNSQYRFNFKQPFTSNIWKSMFRFEKEDILDLVQQFQIPDPLPTVQGYKVSALEALCIFLRRMAYPARLVDLQDLFGRDQTAISSISNAVLDYLHSKFSYLLSFDNIRLTKATLLSYARAIHAKGAPLLSCVGFIDGTVREICRPTKYQKYVYNGHKRKHALKYQSVIAPDGIIIHLSGPYPGTRHDTFILQQSGLLDSISSYLSFTDLKFVLYGDPAYGQQHHIVAPFNGANITDFELEFNRRMSKVRVSVEWGFGKVSRYWAFVDFAKNQKLFLQRLGKIYFIAAFLVNVHTCKYGSQTTRFFDINPPQLSEYLHNS